MNLSLLHFYTFFLFRWSCSYNIMLYKHATQRQIYSKEKMVCFNLACKKTAEKRQQIHWWLCDRDRKCILYIKCALKQAQRLKNYGRLVCVVVSMIFDFFFVCRLPFKSINRTSAHRSYWIWNEKKNGKTNSHSGILLLLCCRHFRRIYENKSKKRNLFRLFHELLEGHT